MKLAIELIPKTCWYSNVRSKVSRKVWDALRKDVYAQYNHKCGICGVTGRLEAHEIWDYNDKELLQTLVGMIALCPSCHKIKHFGFSELLASQGKLNLPKLIVHFCQVNDCDINTFLEHKTEAWATWAYRSQHYWKLNIEYLASYGDTFIPPSKQKETGKRAKKA